MSQHHIAPTWELQAHVGALMTCRSGGHSSTPFDSNNFGIYVGDPDAQRNRQHAPSLYNLPNNPLWLKQVHGVDCAYAPDTQHEAEADAVWTNQPNQVLAIQTADCLPVVFADRLGRAVAVAHAGWRGLVGGVLENTVAAMPVEAADLHCWIGAAIGPCCFEVGTEVRAAFVAAHSADADCFAAASEGKWMGDLSTLAKRRLHRSGVATVSGGDLCASCDSARFFSYRRDAGATGRMATLVWIKA